MPKYDVKQVVRILNHPGKWVIEDYIEQDNSYIISMFNGDGTLSRIAEDQLTLISNKEEPKLKYEIKDGFVQVPIDVFQDMEKDVQLLYALKAAGVEDDWNGYDYVMEKLADAEP